MIFTLGLLPWARGEYTRGVDRYNGQRPVLGFRLTRLAGSGMDWHKPSSDTCGGDAICFVANLPLYLLRQSLFS